jgi:hypothetical protein
VLVAQALLQDVLAFGVGAEVVDLGGVALEDVFKVKRGQEITFSM